MGAAAYNRGTRSLTESILREHGRWRDPPAPKKRSADWGEKTRARAEARARSILSGVRRYGLAFSVEIIAGAVRERERCTEETAMAAAVKAFAESG